jgi:hypothetical protein
MSKSKINLWKIKFTIFLWAYSFIISFQNEQVSSIHQNETFSYSLEKFTLIGHASGLAGMNLFILWNWFIFYTFLLRFESMRNCIYVTYSTDNTVKNT